MEKEIQIQQLSAALETSSRTIKALEERLLNARGIIKILEQEKKQWEQQKELQEKIIKQQIETMEVEKRTLQSEVIDLREKLKAA